MRFFALFDCHSELKGSRTVKRPGAARLRLVLALALSVATAGCGKPTVTQIKGNIPFDQVPAAVLKTARAKDPTVRFNDAVKRADGVYEVNGKNAKGKLIRVEVKESGEFVKFG
jgi:hypothetical protein